MGSGQTQTYGMSQPVLDCLGMLAVGKTLSQIAAEMKLSEPAVADLLSTACVCLSARNHAHLVNLALRKGLI